MSHSEQTAWVAKVKALYPDAFTGKRVLEIGSYNINGSVRGFFTDCAYLGVDVSPGPGVDIVTPRGAAAWLVLEERMLGVPRSFETIITTECLEHDIQWDVTLAEAQRVLVSGGMLIITCAGSKRPEHGTRRTTPTDVAPHFPWPDYYRGLDEIDLRAALRLNDFRAYEFGICQAPHDTYFWGVRK